MKKKIAQALLKINAVKLNPKNPFTWTSGIKSPIYCDNRLSLSYPATRNLIIKGLKEKSNAFGEFDMVMGVATAGIPHGAILAHVLKKPFGYIRDKAKGHGRQNQIEGLIIPNAKVLVIEDLISTGLSSLKAVEAVREAGMNVVGVLAIFNYGFEETDKVFAEKNCPFVTLSDYDALLEVAEAVKYINTSELEDLKQWRVSPSTWRQ